MTGMQPHPFERKSLEVWAILFLLFSSAGQIYATLDENWNRSLSLFDQNNHGEACMILAPLATSASSVPISPDVHFNYSLCSWKQQEPDLAIYHLMKSSLLTLSPKQIWSNLELIRAYQREIGIMNSLVNSLSFTLFLYAQENYLVLFGCLAIWCLLVDLSFPKLFLYSRRLFRSAFVISWISIGTLVVNQKLCGKIAVLFSNEAITVYSKKDNKPEKLADLPRGTLVSYGKESEEYTLILKPISGWIKSNQLRDILN